jgi:hypothetical protein
MKLPNAHSASVDLRKLQDYCLNPEHPRGKNKARVFQSALGVGRKNAEELRSLILSAVGELDCIPGESDEYGSRYFVDIEWQRLEKSATIRTMWMVKRNEDIPRMTSCYVL